MNDDQIRQWATDIWGATLWTELQIQRLKRFATRAVELEREACATACEDIANNGENTDNWTITRDKAFHDCAEAIRARGKA